MSERRSNEGRSKGEKFYEVFQCAS